MKIFCIFSKCPEYERHDLGRAITLTHKYRVGIIANLDSSPFSDVAVVFNKRSRVQ